MTYKECSTCNRRLPISGFQIRRASKDGRTAACRECLSERDRLRESPARAAAREAYQKTERGRVAAGRAKLAYIERNPSKRQAHNAVNNAVKDGRMTKPEACEECGGEGIIHGHHDDYSKPLDVKWLCTACHSAAHKEMR